jgi:hypothetical protein
MSVLFRRSTYGNSNGYLFEGKIEKFPRSRKFCVRETKNVILLFFGKGSERRIIYNYQAVRRFQIRLV